MGQKTNPNLFRLVSTQKHLSWWYEGKFFYSILIKEDFLIRQKIQESLKDFLFLSKIEIDRVNGKNYKDQYVNIKIHTLYPRVREIYRKNKDKIDKFTKNEQELNFTAQKLKDNVKKITNFFIKKYIKNLTKFFQSKLIKKFNITIHFISNIFEDANLIARYLGIELQRRIPFRRVIKQMFKKISKTRIEGIKVEMSGRLNGIEIARSEWKRLGSVPLHTLKANIDYAQHSIKTIDGLIGVKVWVFNGKSLKNL